MTLVLVLLVLLSSIQALLIVGAAGWLLMSAVKSTDVDAEEQEGAMFRALAADPASPAVAPAPPDGTPALVCPEMVCPEMVCPEMPDLARLGAALSETQTEAQTKAPTEAQAEPQAEAVHVRARLPR